MLYSLSVKTESESELNYFRARRRRRTRTKMENNLNKYQDDNYNNIKRDNNRNDNSLVIIMKKLNHIRTRKVSSSSISNIILIHSIMISLSLIFATCNYTSAQQQQAQSQLSPDQQISSSSSSSSSSLTAPSDLTLAQIGTGGQQHQEIFVLPNEPVRIGCKLPQLTPDQHRLYYWNFQRTTTGATKPRMICFESKCIDESTFGIQLDTDPRTGSYDLVISNVTYELHDGLYFCDYSDSGSKQTINLEYRLTVLMPPQQPEIIVTNQAQTAREGQEFQLACVTSGANPEPNITWYRDDQPILFGSSISHRIEQSRINQTTTSTLRWTPTSEDHQSNFRCSVWNKAMAQGRSYEASYQLQVEYAPRIRFGPDNPLKILQGQWVTLSCQVDANPPVKSIKWLKDGHFVSYLFNYTIQGARTSDSSVYTCSADNGIAPISAATQNAGQVLGPSSSLMSLFTSLSYQSNSQQEKPSTTVEAQLHLQVLYGPMVTVKPAGSASSKLSPLNENDPLTLNCSVDSSPAPFQYIWTKQDDPSFKRIQTDPLLSFSAILAQDTGNYTCTAYNRLEPSGHPSQVIEKHASSSIQVNVRHKPGLAEIQLGQNGETTYGQKTLIQCSAKPPGYPQPQYNFYKHHGSHSRPSKAALTRSSSGPIYTIHSAKLDDEGKFSCIATNELGHSTEADGDLIVNEPPSIAQDKTKLEDSQLPNEPNYSILFRAYGKPEPKVTWWHRSPIDGRRQELSIAEMQSRFRIETSTYKDQTSHSQLRPRIGVVTTLRFLRPLSIEDRGQYSVEFDNGVLEPAIGRYQLHIFHNPPLPVIGNGILQAVKTNDQLQPHVKTKAGYDLGETVNLTCRVSAYPQPIFDWYSNDVQVPIASGKESETSVNSRYSQQISNVRDDIWESTLSFRGAQESDYGDYMCVSSNNDQKGKLSQSIPIIVSLTRKTAPETPGQLEAIESTQDSITLQWIPGFDGGFAQNHFQVQFALEDGSGISLSKRFPQPDLTMYSNGGSNSFGDSELDNERTLKDSLRTFECQSSNPCVINQLQSRQSYLFRVRARNELGSSEFSEELRASTRANISQIPRIAEASFDPSHNILHFKIEQGSDYLLTSLNVRIETSGSSSTTNSNNIANQHQEAGDQLEWRPQASVPITQEKVQAYLDMLPGVEQMRLTLCSRSNDSLCGPEYVISMRSATSSFLHDQRGLNFSILFATVMLIVVLGGFATTIHACCLSRKNKKASAIERVDSGSLITDNKPSSGGSSNSQKNGSTASTNSTSAGADTANGIGVNGLQSMDSLMMANGGQMNHLAQLGSSSDHSSDHSRQAKLDLMLPPNYNHYADRASIMQEQQQQQQQQYIQSAYGQANGTLLGVASQRSPNTLLGHSFSYAPNGYSTGNEQQPISFDHHLFSNGLGDPMATDVQQQQQQSVWPMGDDYTTTNNYNNNALINSLAYQQQQPDNQHQSIDPTYGTLMQHQSGIYDNGANAGQQHFQSYLSDPQRASSRSAASSSYQQEIAAAQQQMYGTLTRNNTNIGPNTAGTSNEINQSASLVNQEQSQLVDQYNTIAAAAAANGLAHSNPPMESDYGTVGSRSGRLIREIIV